MNAGLRRYVILRDGGCVARFVNSHFWASRWPMLQALPDPGPCGDNWGRRINPTQLDLMEADHVKDELGMAIREDDPYQLWTMCPFHHRGALGSGWATRSDVRAAARQYIAAANVIAIDAGWPRIEDVTLYGGQA